MKRSEWTLLAVLIGGVAFFEIVGGHGRPTSEPNPPEHTGEKATARSAESSRPASGAPSEDRRGPYRTVALHVTGMT